MRVIVIGAGVGGLTLAQGLRRAGIDVVVYERDGRRGRPQGISLHFDDRGAAALDACLPPAHTAMAQATMGGLRERTQLLSEQDGELAIVGARPLDGAPTRPGRQVSRPVLRAVLLSGLEDVVHFGSAFTGFEQRADGTVTARFADDSADTADVLVGADGIGSAVRRQYLPDVQVIDTGKRMLMGATPLRAVADTGLPELIGHDATSVQTNGTMLMALGVLRFTQAPVAARDQWLPALRCAAITDAEDYVMWALPTAADRVGAAERPPEVTNVARALIAHAHPTLRQVVDNAWPALTVALRIGVIPPMRAWPTSPVTVIGDAIHVAPGFGGNLAMQDAHRLRDALVSAAAGERELLAAIGDYEDQMRSESFPVPVT